MIPKMIHYCWFGRGEMSQLNKKCIQTWEDVLPDYEIMLWDEDNFDVHSVRYTSEAYRAKKYAYVSDYVRLYALLKYGGIYLDTDVSMIRSFDDLLDSKGFVGMEDDNIPGTCVIAAEKGSVVIQKFFDHYKDRSFFTNYGFYDLEPNTVVLKQIFGSEKVKLDNKEMKDIDGFMIYSSEYFSPQKCVDGSGITEKTYSVHHFDGSWLRSKDKKEIEYERIRSKYVKIFGDGLGSFFCRNSMRIKKMGALKWIGFMLNKIGKEMVKGH